MAPVLDGSQSFFIPGRLPGLNEIIAARASRYRGNYNDLKQSWTAIIGACAKAAGLGAFTRPVSVHFDYREPNMRRDPDNVNGACVKLCLDALVKCGVLHNDGWKQIAGLSCTWRVDANTPGVLVTIAYAVPL